MTTPRPLVTIICPVYNEEVCVPLFFARIEPVLAGLRDRYAFELVFTNNGSTDGTVREILAIRESHPWVKLLSLSRNFGYQASLTSGLRNAAGDAVMMIDVDCEDPPELIPRFLEAWSAGHDIVYGQRDDRPEHFLVKGARKLFYRLTQRVADNDFILDMAEFLVMSRRVVNVCTRNRSSFPFIRNEVAFAGFRRQAIPYERKHRIAGQTHYNFARMFQFAVAGILTSSTFPLRLAMFAGVTLAAVDLIVAVVGLATDISAILPSLALLNLAFLLTSVGTVSVYVARIYKDCMGRPLFVVDARSSVLDRQVVDDLGRPVPDDGPAGNAA